MSRTDTSDEAYASVIDEASRLRAEVHRAIRDAGDQGATCDEVEVRLAMRHQTASARVRELALRDRVVDSGTRRRTRSGRTAIVWRAA